MTTKITTSIGALILFCTLSLSVQAAEMPKVKQSADAIIEQNSLYGSFMDAMLRPVIYEEIRRQYNISESTPGGYASSSQWVNIRRGTKGDHEITIKIKPNNVEHYDRVTFSVYARSLRFGKGITLLKYEKAVEK